MSYIEGITVSARQGDSLEFENGSVTVWMTSNKRTATISLSAHQLRRLAEWANACADDKEGGME